MTVNAIVQYWTMEVRPGSAALLRADRFSFPGNPGLRAR